MKKFLVVVMVVLSVCTLAGVCGAIGLLAVPTEQLDTNILPVPTVASTATSVPTVILVPIWTLTPVPAPTSTAVPDPNLILPGTYLVGKDIQPGLYSGQAGAEIFESCYWARLNSLSGELGAIIANDNAMGPYYVEVAASDFALETHCELRRE